MDARLLLLRRHDVTPGNDPSTLSDPGKSLALAPRKYELLPDDAALYLRTNALPKASPNLNGRCERFMGTIHWECLDKFIIFGKRHLDYLVADFVDYYNTKRAHMERDHLPPIRSEPEEVNTLRLDQIEVKSYVGGLVKSFERKAT